MFNFSFGLPMLIVAALIVWSWIVLFSVIFG